MNILGNKYCESNNIISPKNDSTISKLVMQSKSNQQKFRLKDVDKNQKLIKDFL